MNLTGYGFGKCYKCYQHRWSNGASVGYVESLTWACTWVRKRIGVRSAITHPPSRCDGCATVAIIHEMVLVLLLARLGIRVDVDGGGYVGSNNTWEEALEEAMDSCVRPSDVLIEEDRRMVVSRLLGVNV